MEKTAKTMPISAAFKAEAEVMRRNRGSETASKTTEPDV
jgi:hypothetical protein